MLSPLIRKLEIAVRFIDEGRMDREQLCSRSRSMRWGRTSSIEVSRQGDVHLVLEGIVYRYKLMPDGKRQIVATARARRLLRPACGHSG